MKLEREALADVELRLRRAQGQIGGIIKMIEEGRDRARSQAFLTVRRCASP